MARSPPNIGFIKYRLGSPGALAEIQGFGHALAKTLSENLTSRPSWARKTRVRKGTAVQVGAVKWFNSEKGFGFIQPEQGGGDVFGHISAVERAGIGSLREGQKLSFELERDRRSGKTAAAQLQLL